MTLHEKLIAVQSALSVPKENRNAFGGYNYRSCEDILEAVKPLLKEHELALTLSDEIVMVGTRYYVKATAMVQELHEDKDEAAHFGVTAYAREEETKKGMDGAQITGSASSYARKYALNGLFCIDDTKDADATNDHGKAPQKVEKPALKIDAEKAELAKLKGEIWKFCGGDLTKVTEAAAKVGVKSPATMNLAEAKKVFNHLLDSHQ